MKSIRRFYNISRIRLFWTFLYDTGRYREYQAETREMLRRISDPNRSRGVSPLIETHPIDAVSPPGTPPVEDIFMCNNPVTVHFVNTRRREQREILEGELANGYPWEDLLKDWEAAGGMSG